MVTASALSWGLPRGPVREVVGSELMGEPCLFPVTLGGKGSMGACPLGIASASTAQLVSVFKGKEKPALSGFPSRCPGSCFSVTETETLPKRGWRLYVLLVFLSERLDLWCVGVVFKESPQNCNCGYLTQFSVM